MLETATIITIIFLLLAKFRPGKTPPLANPLVINSPQYHATLSPGLNLAEPFVRKIAAALVALPPEQQTNATLHLKVSDPTLRNEKIADFLLSIELRDGRWNFHATHMQNDASGQLKEFVDEGGEDEHLAMLSAIREIADKMKISLSRLTAAS